MPKILLTNDDGIDSESLALLKKELSDLGECIVVAPDSQRSASAHAVSVGQSISVSECEREGAFFGYQVSGTPVDCVKVALCKLFADNPPDLIVSGINVGPNTGVSVVYSGTVGAAREGTIAGVPSIAASMCDFEYDDFEYAAKVVKRIAARVLKTGLPKWVTLNVNVPPLQEKDIRGIKITKQAHSRFIEEYIKEVDEKGCEKFQLTGELELVDTDKNNDEQAVKDGYVSVCPIQVDMTAFSAINDLEDLVE